MSCNTRLKWLERLLFGAGSSGLLLVGLVYLDAALAARSALAAFDAAVAQTDARSATTRPLDYAAPDQSLWSAQRKASFQPTNNDLPLAVLEIERLGLEVPVFPGADPVTLNRGAGVVDGTALPGEPGNVALSAHRDGFFRPLKDIRVGDRIALRTLNGELEYAVQQLFITDPLDISVLEPTDDDTLTLITCYPFYYVGYAPERLIVRARPVDDRVSSR